MSDDRGGFVPVEVAALEALAASMADVREAETGLRGATEALLELAGDLKVDAVRRLRERGASEAQVERYEAAYRDGVARLRRRASRLDARLEALEAAIRTARG
jgi:hypothetical protein